VRPGSETTVEFARLLMATGDREGAVGLLQREVRNSPDDAALLTEIQEVFAGADMAEEGATLVAASRREAIEMMNRGALLARDGKLDEAVVWMRNACQAMPANVRVLFNFAHVIVTRMQQGGADADLIAEARSSLEAANVLAPGDRRFGLLNSALDKLEAGG
jgi:Flp pilus assembly protein TadD